MKQVVAVILAALLAGGCAAAPKPTTGLNGDGPGSPQPQADPKPVACGTEEMRHGTGYDAAMRECLWKAYTDGDKATFTSTILTTEGDPIIRDVRVLSREEIQLSVDTTKDKFSAKEDQKVTVYTCTRMERELVNREGQDRIQFKLTGCEGGPTKEIRL